MVPDADSAAMFKGVYYPVYGISLGYNRQVSYKSKIGFGIGFDYFGAANSSISLLNGNLRIMMPTFPEGFEVSIFPSYELVIDRLSLILQPGFYIHRRSYEGQTPWTYQRIGSEISYLPESFHRFESSCLSLLYLRLYRMEYRLQIWWKERKR